MGEEDDSGFLRLSHVHALCTRKTPRAHPRNPESLNPNPSTLYCGIFSCIIVQTILYYSRCPVCLMYNPANPAAVQVASQRTSRSSIVPIAWLPMMFKSRSRSTEVITAEGATAAQNSEH